MTKYAKEILDIINASSDHLTAEEIFLKLKKKNSKVVLATIYNNLNTLVKNGAIRQIAISGGSDRYDKTVRHDHMICAKCGKISDFTFNDLTKKITEQSGHKILSYDLKISYICDDCNNIETD